MPEFKELKDTLYVKLPIAINEEITIKNLHPDIEDVRIPRQKRARFCTIKFTDLEKCEKVKNDLHEKTVDGKRIIVSYGRKKILKNEKECIKLTIMKLPNNIHKKEVQKAIPKATKVKIRRANKIKNCKFTWALLVFESKSDAAQVVSKGTLNIKDVDYKVEYYKGRGSQQHRNGKENKSIKRGKDKSKSKDQNVTPRYYQIAVQNSDDGDSDDSADSVITDVSNNLDLESFDLEYTGSFNSDSD